MLVCELWWYYMYIYIYTHDFSTITRHCAKYWLLQTPCNAVLRQESPPHCVRRNDGTHKPGTVLLSSREVALMPSNWFYFCLENYWVFKSWTKPWYVQSWAKQGKSCTNLSVWPKMTCLTDNLSGQWLRGGRVFMGQGVAGWQGCHWEGK